MCGALRDLCNMSISMGLPEISSVTWQVGTHTFNLVMTHQHDDVIKWKHFSRYWPFVRGIHRSPVNSPQKGQWRGALMFSSSCARINGWVNNGEAGDLRRHRAHYDVIVMITWQCVDADFTDCHVSQGSVTDVHVLGDVTRVLAVQTKTSPQWFIMAGKGDQYSAVPFEHFQY